MAKNTLPVMLANARDEGFREGFKAGLQSGRQQILDMMSLTLRNPKVMKKDTFGKKRLLCVVKDIGDNIVIYQPAWEKNDETDYYRAKLDDALVEAYGELLHNTFSERYIYAPEFDYITGRWKK